MHVLYLTTALEPPRLEHPTSTQEQWCCRPKGVRNVHHYAPGWVKTNTRPGSPRPPSEPPSSCHRSQRLLLCFEIGEDSPESTPAPPSTNKGLRLHTLPHHQHLPHLLCPGSRKAPESILPVQISCLLNSLSLWWTSLQTCYVPAFLKAYPPSSPSPPKEVQAN